MVALPGRDRDPEEATAPQHRLQLDQGLGNSHPRLGPPAVDVDHRSSAGRPPLVAGSKASSRTVKTEG
jgi:hypothetical protein